MSKKKDTLKDLNEFMNKQAAKTTDKKPYLEKDPTGLAEVERLQKEIRRMDDLPANALKEEDIAQLVQKIAKSNNVSARQVLYRVCEKVLSEQAEKDSSDIMLLNTILYIKHHDLLVDKLQ